MDVNTKLPRGQVNSPAVDSKFGRRWMKRGEDKLPVLYSRIGEPLRNPKLHRTICRWVIGAPNWRRLVSERFRKRWPTYRGLRASLFAEFAMKSFESKSFFEKAHCLPFHGVGGSFWRGPEGCRNFGNYFRLSSIDFTVRPWKGEARGDMYMNGIKIRSDVAPLAKSVGKWNFEPPSGASKLYYRPSFPNRSSPYTE